MDWSAMFDAEVVVFGCGNVLFGDDGLAPRAVAQLAAEAAGAAASAGGGGAHALAGVAFVDAGTSIRTLLTDMTLMGARPRRVIVLDVVQQPGRAPGSIVRENLDARHDGDPAGGFMHHAPTWGLLRRLRDDMHADVVVITVQAARIPELMDDTLSPEAQAALPQLLETVRALCALQQQNC